MRRGFSSLRLAQHKTSHYLRRHYCSVGIFTGCLRPQKRLNVSFLNRNVSFPIRPALRCFQEGHEVPAHAKPPSFQFPSTFQSKPYVFPKFLSIQSRGLPQLTKAQDDIKSRQEKLLRAREEQLRSLQPSGPSSSVATLPPLTLHLARDLDVLEKKIVQLEGTQGFTLPDAIVYDHFTLLVRLGAYAPALQWLEEKIVMERRGPPFPLCVRQHLQEIMHYGIRPALPDSSASIRFPAAAPLCLSPAADKGTGSSTVRMMEVLLARFGASAMPLSASMEENFSGDSIVQILGRFEDFFRIRSPQHANPAHVDAIVDDEAEEEILSFQNATLHPPSPYHSTSSVHPIPSPSDGSLPTSEGQAVSEGGGERLETMHLRSADVADPDLLLRIAHIANFLHANGEGGSAAVLARKEDGRGSASSGFSPPPLHPTYTHHVLVAQLMPLMHVMEQIGMLFDDISPIRRGNESKEETGGVSLASPLTLLVPSKSLESSQALAIRRVLHLFSANSCAGSEAIEAEEVNQSRSPDLNEKPVESGPSSRSTPLTELQNILDLYSLLVELVCEVKEPMLLVLVQISLLAGFFQIREDTNGVHHNRAASKGFHVVVHEGWLQNVVENNSKNGISVKDEASSDHNEVKAARELLHEFAYESLIRLSIARQSVLVEKMLVWRSVGMLQGWRALFLQLQQRQSVGSSAGTGPRPPQKLPLCRAFQCLHYEWARTEVGCFVSEEGKEEGDPAEKRLVGAPEMACHHLPLIARAQAGYPYTRLKPNARSLVLPEHQCWHNLWAAAGDCSKELLLLQLQQKDVFARDLILKASWLVGLTTTGSVTHQEPSLLRSRVLEELIPPASTPSLPTPGLSALNSMPAWLGERAATAQLMEKNAVWLELLRHVLLQQIPVPPSTHESGDQHELSYTTIVKNEIPLQWDFSLHTAGSEVHQLPYNRSTFLLEWDTLAERLLIALSLDLHHVLLEVAPFPASGGEPDQPEEVSKDSDSSGSAGFEAVSSQPDNSHEESESRTQASEEEDFFSSGEPIAEADHSSSDGSMDHSDDSAVKQYSATLQYWEKVVEEPHRRTVQHICREWMSGLRCLLTALQTHCSLRADQVDGEEAPSLILLATLATVLNACDWVPPELPLTGAAPPSGESTHAKTMLKQLLLSSGRLGDSFKAADNASEALPSTHAAPSLHVDAGNAIALLALAAVRGGLWSEGESLLLQLLEKDTGDVSACSAVQLDPSLLVSIFLEARAAGKASVCSLLRKHREDIYFA